MSGYPIVALIKATKKEHTLACATTFNATMQNKIVNSTSYKKCSITGTVSEMGGSVSLNG